MKLKRICALALCSALCAGLVTLTASADDRKTNEDVETSKTVEKNGDYYDVTIEAYVDGSATINTEKVYPDLDIVIAMDVSNAMNEYMTVADKTNSETLTNMDTEYGANENVYQLNDTLTDYALIDKWRRMKHDDTWKYMAWKYGGDSLISDDTSKGWIELNSLENSGAGAEIHIKKIDAEKIAVQNLLNEVAARKATANAANAEVGAAAVNYNVSVVQYAGSTQGTDGSAQAGTSNIVCALTDNYSSIRDKVVDQTAFVGEAVKDRWDNPTRSTSGKDYLEQALTQAGRALVGSDEKTKKIVILFSSSNTDRWSSYETRVDGKAVQLAKELGATVYTVSVGKSSDPTLENIASTTGGKFNGYTTSNALNDAFGTIFNQIEDEFVTGGANTTLGVDAVLRDTITEYFEIVGTPEAYSAKENGEKIDTYPATTSSDGRTVEVKGFDYSAHWIGTNAKDPQKMVLKFSIKPKDGFLGGNGVPTNESSSGIYLNTVVENFEACSVSVPLADLTVEAQDKNVYLTNTLTADQMKDGAVVKFGNTTLDFTKSNYGLDEWQVEYIDSISLTKAEIAEGFDSTGDSTYTLTGKITSGSASKEFTDTAAINVFKPELTYSNETIYLGNEPSFEYTEQWKHGNTLDTAVTMIGQKPELSNLGYNQTDFTSCKTVNLSTIKVGNTTLTGNDLTACVTAESFKVHVKTPEIEGTEQTIYYGNSTNLAAKIADWKDCTCKGNKPSVSGDPKTPHFTYSSSTTSVSPTECQEYTVALTSIGKAKNLTGYTDEFTVHVLTPTISGKDTTIYRGNAANLNSLMNDVVWADAKNHKSDNIPLVSGDEPKPTYTYMANGESINSGDKPEDCVSVTATWNLGGHDFTTEKSFTVHVLQPVFTVTTQDVWADYKTDVDLATNCVSFDSSTGITWEDKKNGIGHTAPAVDETKKPVFDTVTYTFGSDAQEYSVTDADKAFNLTAAKFTFDNGYEQTENYTDKSFTVHVNKFQLTINKTWDGAGCYKQDAIFTVTGGKNSTDSFKVVIPKEKTSVTIGGLLCGQNYTVTEDGNWSWRWTSSNTGNTTTGYSSHTHTAVTNTDPMSDEDPVKMSFTNTLKDGKSGREDRTLWLSGSNSKINTAKKKKSN